MVREERKKALRERSIQRPIRGTNSRNLVHVLALLAILFGEDLQVQLQLLAILGVCAVAQQPPFFSFRSPFVAAAAAGEAYQMNPQAATQQRRVEEMIGGKKAGEETEGGGGGH